MNLPSSWVDALFAKLTLRYGVTFTRQWADLDIDAVKAEWAQVLGGFSFRPEAIAYALENLPLDRPPNPMQFRALCNAGLRDEAARALPAPHTPADPERVKELVSRVGSAVEQSDLSPAEYCAQRIRAIAKERGGMSIAQKEMIEACASVNVTSGAADFGQFNPIDPAVLPPGMRE